MANYSATTIRGFFFESLKYYQKDCVNYKGNTTDEEHKPYTEVIAEEIIRKSNRFVVDVYPPQSIKKSFVYERNARAISSKSEKGLCQRWEKEGFGDEAISFVLGRPLIRELNIVENRKVNVDLVSYNDVTKELFLIEAKGKMKKGDMRYSSDKTLLRCILEIETYYETLLQAGRFGVLKRDLGVPEEATVRKAILIPKNSEAAKEYQNPSFRSVNSLLGEGSEDKIVVIKF